MANLMNKTGAVLGLVISLVLFVIACKHEIPGQTDTGGNNPPSSVCSPDTAYFQSQVLPIIISNCSVGGCHDNITHEDGIVLTSYNSIMSTGNIKPGNPGNSELYKKIIEHSNDERMPPPSKPVQDTEIEYSGTKHFHAMCHDHSR